MMMMSGFVVSHSAASSARFPFTLLFSRRPLGDFKRWLGVCWRLNVTDHLWTMKQSRCWSIGWGVGCCGRVVDVLSLGNTHYSQILSRRQECLQVVQNCSKCCRHGIRRSCSNESRRHNIPMTWMQYYHTLLCPCWCRFCETTRCMRHSIQQLSTSLHLTHRLHMGRLMQLQGQGLFQHHQLT